MTKVQCEGRFILPGTECLWIPTPAGGRRRLGLVGGAQHGFLIRRTVFSASLTGGSPTLANHSRAAAKTPITTPRIFEVERRENRRFEGVRPSFPVGALNFCKLCRLDRLGNRYVPGPTRLRPYVRISRRGNSPEPNSLSRPRHWGWLGGGKGGGGGGVGVGGFFVAFVYCFFVWFCVSFFVFYFVNFFFV